MRRRLTVIGTAVVLVLAVLGTLIFQGLPAPDFLRSRIEARLTAQLGGQDVRIREIRLSMFQHGLNPVLSMQELTLEESGGRLRARIPSLSAEVAIWPLIAGKVRPVSVLVDSAQFRLKRNAEGKIDFQIGDETEDATDAVGLSASPEDLKTLLKTVENYRDIPALRHLKRVVASNSYLVFSDAVSHQTWRLENGRFLFEDGADGQAATVTFKLKNQAGDPARVAFLWRREAGEDVSILTTNFNNLDTSAIAAQLPALGWMRVLEAQASGSLSVDVSPDTGLGNLRAVLDIGNGRIRQAGDNIAARFNGASMRLVYDGPDNKVTFDELRLDTELANFRGAGVAYITSGEDGVADSLIAQVQFTDLNLDPPGLFAAPLSFARGAVDMRVRLDNLSIDIGQLVLEDRDTRYVLKGAIAPVDDQWQGRLDLSVDQLPAARLKALWPLTFKPKTRDWLAKNLLGGMAQNATASVRIAPGALPEITLGFDIADANVRFLKGLPPIEQGSGYGLMRDNMLTIVMEDGGLTAPNGAAVDLSGSIFRIVDTRVKFGLAEVDLKTKSSVTSLLEVIDLPPFEFLSKAGIATDIAQGHIETGGKVAFNLMPKIQLADVDLSMTGELSQMRSDALVAGKTLAADTLKAVVDKKGLTISGRGTLEGLPVSGVWRQNFGPDAKGRSRLDGRVELSARFLSVFNISLPKDMVSGTGSATLTVDLAQGQKPHFQLVSDLERVALALSPLGWAKPAGETGELLVAGRFGTPPLIETLELSAPGLDVTGRVDLKADGSLDVARFPEVNVGNWFRSPIEIRPGTDGMVDFTLLGGAIDFRRSKFSSSTSTGQGSRIAVRLDRLVLSDSIAVTDIQGDLDTTGGMSGAFEGRVNGGARIVGTMAPLPGGTAVRLTSDNAGAVMKSAGIFDSVIDGRLDMLLFPSGKTGVYNGSLNAQGPRVQNATALSEILTAISVVGIVEQLDGSGITFTDVDAKFVLTPSAITLTEASAVGSSLGLTMEGYYDFAGDNMDMQGVITPIYALNGLFEQSKLFGQFFGKKRGEGLIGFTYTLSGSADAPIVGVNPLSALTPGLFREIFRKPIPKPPE